MSWDLVYLGLLQYAVYVKGFEYLFNKEVRKRERVKTNGVK